MIQSLLSTVLSLIATNSSIANEHQIRSSAQETASEERFAKKPARVRFEALDPQTGKRIPTKVQLITEGGGGFEGILYEPAIGTTPGENSQPQPYLTVTLVAGTRYEVRIATDDWKTMCHFRMVAEDGMLVTAGDPNEHPWTDQPLTSSQAERARARWTQELENSHLKWRKESKLKPNQIRCGLREIREFWHGVFGEHPARGRSLYICLEQRDVDAPRNATARWEELQAAFAPEEGVYVIPRLRHDAWHPPLVTDFLHQLIDFMIVSEGVDPDRVYLLGYAGVGGRPFSAISTMADRFAAVTLFAEVVDSKHPENLSSLPFAWHSAGTDAQDWSSKVGRHSNTNPKDYSLCTELIAADRNLVAAHFKRMSAHSRNAQPSRILWRSDIEYSRGLYWLYNVRSRALPQPVVAEHLGQIFTILEAPPHAHLGLQLDDSLCDLDQEVVVRYRDKELYRGIPARTTRTTVDSFSWRLGELSSYYSTVTFEIPGG